MEPTKETIPQKTSRIFNGLAEIARRMSQMQDCIGRIDGLAATVDSLAERQSALEVIGGEALATIEGMERTLRRYEGNGLGTLLDTFAQWCDLYGVGGELDEELLCLLDSHSSFANSIDEIRRELREAVARIDMLERWSVVAKADALRTLGYNDTEIAECIEDVPDLTPDDVAYARTVAEAWNPDKATYTSADLTDSRLRILPKLAFNEAATVQNLFQKCPELAYVPTLDFPKATSIPYIWFYLTKLKRLPTINAPVATNISALYSTANDTVKILPTAISLPEATNIKNLFHSQSAEAMSCVQELNLDKTKIKTAGQAFRNSGVDRFMLTDLPEANDVSAMYRNCANIKGDQSEVKWNMPKVTTISGMFANMEALTALDVSGIKTDNCTDMGECFGWTPALESLDLTGWNAEKVTSAEGMFFGCGARSIKWPGMKFAEGCSIGTMFYDASRLVTLDIAGADFTGAVQNGSNNPIFGFNNALENIIGPVSGISFNVNLSSAPKLTPESAMVIINGLTQTDTTLRLWLHRNIYDKLTPEQIAIATAKGWTVARA